MFRRENYDIYSNKQLGSFRNYPVDEVIILVS
ncbi:Uncharacterised protein [Clostridium perfringens]|uniref:Uncharacterized protein n=1 Tax=Clostridium perfringens TaxID=1502 RepID=A0A2X3AIF2_CLOPF|nr:Uncharacterised protein [Clostridium perfringens]